MKRSPFTEGAERMTFSTTTTVTPLPRRRRSRCSIMMTTTSTLLLLKVLFALVYVVFVVNAGWVDIDTPLDKRTTKSFVDGTTYELVMSDEFNVDNRTFTDGHDPIWTALDKSDDDASSAGGGSMQFYNSSAVTTQNGFLKISTYREKTAWNHYNPITKSYKHVQTNFTSGMMQSWNKFCFTGGIIEVDVIFPGSPYIGGLWPAIWMLGNLGRATYEASTNNIWPWSYDNKCDRILQPAQTISSCNLQNHFGMLPYRGRGATEIDIVEVMAGSDLKNGNAIAGTNPAVSYPYADFTLQVAPGVVKNRPQSGTLPIRQTRISKNGHTEFFAQSWYDGLEIHGNTSMNPFFYGTFLDETKPGEPVTRTKEQAFQADAVGVVHQLTPAHFKEPHTIRVEWQPGRGGRLDWFVKGYSNNNNNKHNSNTSTTVPQEGDGHGQDWIRVYTLKDISLETLTGSQIPMEPSYLIMNTAVSSTWGFPYDAPEWCPKNCFDCDDPKCTCSFFPGFCPMLEDDGVTMYIDSIRVYQTTNHSAHVGQPHSLGCDPIEYPTREWIIGHEYRYMRNPPFVFDDKKPLRVVQRGGGSCMTDVDCGASVPTVNWTQVYQQQKQQKRQDKNEQQQQEDLGDDDAGRKMTEASSSSTTQGPGRGRCVVDMASSITVTSFLGMTKNKKKSDNNPRGGVCSCNTGFTGPHCLAIDHVDDSPSAYELHMKDSPFHHVFHFHIPTFLCITLGLLSLVFISSWSREVYNEKQAKQQRARTAFLFANHYKKTSTSSMIPPHTIINKNSYNKSNRNNTNYGSRDDEQQSLLPRPLQVGATTTTTTAADNISGITTDSSV